MECAPLLLVNPVHASIDYIECTSIWLILYSCKLTVIRTSGVTFGTSAAIKWRSSSREKSPVYKIYKSENLSLMQWVEGIFYFFIIPFAECYLIQSFLWLPDCLASQFISRRQTHLNPCNFNHKHGRPQHMSSVVTPELDAIYFFFLQRKIRSARHQWNFRSAGHQSKEFSFFFCAQHKGFSDLFNNSKISFSSSPS